MEEDGTVSHTSMTAAAGKMPMIHGRTRGTMVGVRIPERGAMYNL